MHWLVNNMQTHCTYITTIYSLNFRSEWTITVNYGRLLQCFQSLNQIWHFYLFEILFFASANLIWIGLFGLFRFVLRNFSFLINIKSLFSESISAKTPYNQFIVNEFIIFMVKWGRNVKLFWLENRRYAHLIWWYETIHPYLGWD